ncbi:ketopantoate reductase family protein [Marinobacterium arenosum]|uniref:ketopantoate reductase family protein n=1 Tax=Marinobacterium arenosum TaxID=2862496 RepID=UPI001C97A204|nr:2-dehydropantoate 2-reductase [Marinobacterium arenosum]MBY4678602.1 2-dehydropantoate 2-reductase [Marinobacterium arenosum]
MYWHILGAGAIGCLWAAQLCQAGHPVSLILRNPSRLDSFDGQLTLEHDGQCRSFQLAGCLADSCGPIDRLLLTTKAYDVVEALHGVAHQLRPGAQIVLLHNGMGPQQQVPELYPAQQVWSATSTDGAWLREPFHVVWAGRGETRIGRFDAPGEAQLPDGLDGLELQLLADPAIELSLWRKLAINCAINPLTALHGCRNGELLSTPQIHRQMQQVCAEIEQLCQQRQLKLFPDGVLAAAEQVARGTAANYSSMLQDRRNGRRTEIDYITGYLLDSARQLGLALPENERLFKQFNSKKTNR